MITCSRSECRESFCFNCIKKTYLKFNENFFFILKEKETNNNWKCYKCNKKCPCVRCEEEIKQSSPVLRRKRPAIRTKREASQEVKKQRRIKKKISNVLPEKETRKKQAKTETNEQIEEKIFDTVAKIPEKANRLSINKFKIEEREGRKEKVKIGEFIIYEYAESDQEDNQEGLLAKSDELEREKENVIIKKEGRERNFNIFDSAISLDPKNKIIPLRNDQLKEELSNKNKEVNTKNSFQPNAVVSTKSQRGIYEELNNYNFPDITKSRQINLPVRQDLQQLHDNNLLNQTQTDIPKIEYAEQCQEMYIDQESNLNFNVNNTVLGQPENSQEEILDVQIPEREDDQKEENSLPIGKEYLNYCDNANSQCKIKKPLTKPCNVCGNSHLEKYEILKFSTFGDFLKILNKSVNLNPEESYLTIQTDSNLINVKIENRKYLEDPTSLEKLKSEINKIKEDFQNGIIKQENIFKRTKRICHICLSEKLCQEKGLSDLLDCVIEEDEKAELDIVKKEEILRNINTFMPSIQKIKLEETDNEADTKIFNIFDYIFGKKKFNPDVMKFGVSSSINSFDDSSIRQGKKPTRDCKFSLLPSSKDTNQFNNLKFLNDINDMSMSHNADKHKLNNLTSQEEATETLYNLIAKAVYQYSTCQSLSTYNNLIINISFFLLEQYIKEYSEIISRREESTQIIKETLKIIRNSCQVAEISENQTTNITSNITTNIILTNLIPEGSDSLESLKKQNSESSNLLNILKSVLADMKSQSAGILPSDNKLENVVRQDI